MKTVSLICLALCVALATAKSVFEPRIINGANAVEGQFPYQASLRTKSDNEHSCGAAIVNKRFLLSAAHCTVGIESLNSPNVYAVVGSFRLTEGGVIVELDKITPHEKFNMANVENDIALMRTAKEITFTDLIQPIALPKSPLNAAELVIMTGWGKHKFPESFIPDILQFSEVATIDYDKCVKLYDSIPLLQSFVRGNTRTVCTVDKKKGGACHGDSGGPLVDAKNKTIVGVVSWGVPCARGFPDVFTRVHSYLDWINKNMEEQSS